MKTKQNRINRRPGPALAWLVFPGSQVKSIHRQLSILSWLFAKLQTDFLQKADMLLKTRRSLKWPATDCHHLARLPPSQSIIC